MQRKGTAQFTLTYTSDGVPSGQNGIEAQGAGTLDFRRSRARYRIRYDETPGVAGGTTVELVEEGPTTYAATSTGATCCWRSRASWPTRRLTCSSISRATRSACTRQALGASAAAPARSTRASSTSRHGARAPGARRAEFDRTFRGIKTQDFSVCSDTGHVVREYGAEVRVPGGGDFVVRVTTRYTRVAASSRCAR